MRHRHGLLLALAIALSLAVPSLYGGRQMLTLLAGVSPLTVALLLGMVFVGWHLNAGRLRLLAGGTGVRLGQWQALAMLMATEFAICATPAGGGGPVTLAWLLERQALPKSRGLALYAADQFMDMLFFLCALGVIMLYWLIVPSDLHLGLQLAGMVGVLVLTMAVLWLFADRYRSIFAMTGRLLRPLRLSRPVQRRLARGVLEFSRSLRLIRGYSRSRLATVFLLCSAHWLLRYSVLYIAIRAVGGEVSWSYAFLVQMLSLTAGQATLLPGGSGGTEASGSLLLAPYMEPSALAAAVLLWRFATYYWYLLAGAPVFALAVGKPLWQPGRISHQAGVGPT